MVSCLVEIVWSLIGQPLKNIIIDQHAQEVTCHQHDHCNLAHNITMMLPSSLGSKFDSLPENTCGPICVYVYAKRHGLKHDMHFYTLKETLILHVIHLFYIELHAIT